MRAFAVRVCHAILLATAIPSLALAQGPTSIIHVGFTSGGIPGGVHFVSQPAGVVTPMGAITPDEAESNAVSLDPWDASIWIGGITVAPVIGAGEIRHLQYDAAGMMTSSVLVTTLPTAAAGSSVSGLAFNHDGFLLASSGAMGFSVDTSSGIATPIAGPAVPAGTYNAVVAGPVSGAAYFGITAGGGRITMVPRGGGPEVLLGTVMPPSSSSTISGLAVDPAETTLYVSTFGAGNTSLIAFPLPAGPAVVLGGAPVPPLPSLNDVEWDASTSMLVVNSAGADPDSIFIVDPVTGANGLLTVVYGPPGGSPANLDINDSGFGLKAIPEQIYPGASTLCLSLWGTPGCLGTYMLIGVELPGAPPFLVVPIVLKFGAIDSRGCLTSTHAIPPFLIPGGPNVKFHLLGITSCPGAGFSFTPITVWPSI
jgi:hypothetical protein